MIQYIVRDKKRAGDTFVFVDQVEAESKLAMLEDYELIRQEVDEVTGVITDLSD